MKQVATCVAISEKAAHWLTWLVWECSVTDKKYSGVGLQTSFSFRYCCEKLLLLRDWLKKQLKTLLTNGPVFCYFPEPSKSILVASQSVKSLPAEMERFFGDLPSGRPARHIGCLEVITLGLYIWKIRLCRGKGWDFHSTWCVLRLADAASKEQQLEQGAYAALTKSLMFGWRFLQMVVQDCEDIFRPLEKAIAESFLPHQPLGQEFSA